MTAVDDLAAGVPPVGGRRIGSSLVVRGVWHTGTGRTGLAVLVVVGAMALVGPWLSPDSPTAVAGLPFDAPSGSHVLGTDTLGRDVLSRFLHGGRVLVAVALAATALAYVIGVSIGMAIGYRRGGAVDVATSAAVDLMLAFPPIVFVLMLLAAVGTGLSVVIVGIAATHVPRIVRVVRAVTVEVVTREFVEAAVARGEAVRSILARDVLPNIWTPVLADFGLRLTGSVILFSSLSFLGLGQAPPAADWGLMISENQAGLLIQPWVIVVPAVAIALLAIGVNLVADGIARSVGRSITARGV